MKILINTTADGITRFITEIDGRRYRSKYRGCNIAEARKKFRKRVIAAESKLMEEKKQEIINVCLNCQLPVGQCKGNCKLKQVIKIKRGKDIS